MQASLVAFFALAATSIIAGPAVLPEERSLDDSVAKLAREELTSRAPEPYVYLQSVADTVTCDEYPDLANIEIPYHHQTSFGPVNISVSCYTRGRPQPLNRPDQMTNIYLKDSGWGCYMHESQFLGGLGGDTDWEDEYGIPECREKLRPWQGTVLGRRAEDEWDEVCGEISKWPWRVDGSDPNERSRWYEGAHLVGANETERCYVPGDIRKELIWGKSRRESLVEMRILMIDSVTWVWAPLSRLGRGARYAWPHGKGRRRLFDGLILGPRGLVAWWVGGIAGGDWDWRGLARAGGLAGAVGVMLERDKMRLLGRRVGRVYFEWTTTIFCL
ncbi:hypothetical protein BJ875DRAFT_514812 [Amylocarpus encephaloides]|uniref:Uncharacterized protein n=1 Tax=Amylocarpus encephaloides TaxID=45428 RepID=A0A9P8CAL3_9HELO|nr:hypothetical protein BJ875DRAFT_514812 [Amylocarpus encephaloides]